MKKIGLYVGMVLSLSSLYAMEHVLAFFKNMKEISFDATQGNSLYSAYSEDKVLRAIRIHNIFGIAIVDKKNLNNEQECYFTEKQQKQIFGFLAYLFNKKNQEQRGDQDVFLAKGSYSVEPQEMPKDFTWDENER